jgi:hypothetical protein
VKRDPDAAMEPKDAMSRKLTLGSYNNAFDDRCHASRAERAGRKQEADGEEWIRNQTRFDLGLLLTTPSRRQPIEGILWYFVSSKSKKVATDPTSYTHLLWPVK